MNLKEGTELQILLTPDNEIVLRPYTQPEESNAELKESNFNELTGFALVCPITSQTKEYAFEVELPEGLPFTGFVLTDQMKSLDVRKPKLKIIGTLPPDSAAMKAILRNTRAILA